MSRTDALELEYVKLWQQCQINPSAVNDVKFYADKIQQHQAIYESVSDITGVPWYVIAVIHGLESTFNFKTHLHNGDPLTARTVGEPAGRPEQGNPPFTWNESAIDALIYDRATGVKFWTLANTLKFLEGYNGWGYRIGKGRNTTPPCRSPYIYSHTNHYIKGKYTA
ncbi:MAG TPA: hypothetical protein VK211_05830, partial [Kamptonema sp.]|nr:hypothetical protein [Kamptonema sp.]